MANLFEQAFNELNKLYESKEDQERFIAKFGQDRFDRFNKLKTKLANVKDNTGKNISTDILYHVKNTDIKNLDTLLDRAENKQYAVGTITKYDIEGKKIPAPANTKKLITSTANYDIYKVTDYTDSIDLASKKINPNEDAYGYWCISGRYNIKNDDEIKVSQAKQYFYEYLNDKYDAYYFCMPKNHAINKIVICALTEYEDTYTAFSATDDEIDDTDIPNECLSFTDPDTGFTPENYLNSSDAENEEEEEVEDDGSIEYDNADAYFVDYPDDPCKGWFDEINKNFDNFDVYFEASGYSWERNCKLEIYLKDQYFNRCPIMVILDWTADEYYTATYAESTVMYPPDDFDEPLYNLEMDSPDADTFEDELTKLYNALQNINLMAQAIEIINAQAKNINNELDIEPIFDTRVQTLAAYDISINANAIATVAMNIGFDSVEEILKPNNIATAFTSCYTYADYSRPDGTLSEDISDTGTVEVPANKLLDLVNAQIIEGTKEIDAYIKKGN